MRPAFTLGAEASGRDRLSSRHGSCRGSSMNTASKKKTRLLGRAHATLLDLRSLLFDLPHPLRELVSATTSVAPDDHALKHGQRRKR
jgi:hypothetical protein